jgi:hypothetical protein
LTDALFAQKKGAMDLPTHTSLPSPLSADARFTGMPFSPRHRDDRHNGFPQSPGLPQTSVRHLPDTSPRPRRYEHASSGAVQPLPSRFWLCCLKQGLLTLLGFALLSASSLFAGGFGIKHMTAKISIDLQLRGFLGGSPATEEEKLQERETRTLVGIGEKIKLTIEDEYGVAGDLSKAKWIIKETSGGVEGELSLFDESKDVEFNMEETAKPTASSSGEPGDIEIEGESVTLKVKVTSVEKDAQVVVKVFTETLLACEVTFDVVMPLYWRARVQGDAEVICEIPPNASEHWPAIRRDIDMLCTPSNVNFENVYYQEIDMGSPLEMIPPNGVGESFFSVFVHQTGVYYDGGLSDGAAVHESVRPITYAKGDFSSMADTAGGSYYQVRAAWNKNGPFLNPSVDELKQSIMTHGDHSYLWECGFRLYDTNSFYPSESGSEGGGVPLYPGVPLFPIGLMRSTQQKFVFSKHPCQDSDSFMTIITKWRASLTAISCGGYLTEEVVSTSSFMTDTEED